MPDATTYDTFIRREAATLRAKDETPATLAHWQARRAKLREAMLAAIGPIPPNCPLSAKLVGTLKRDGYRIEKLLFQSRPDVWVTASAYVPEDLKAKAPAVLVVHGHWPWARRDPVVQARCLGLVKLGFFVFAVDAFSAGERHPKVARGSYHGALLGSTLWPAGLTLLGVQVQENRRAVDYLLTRPEVDGAKLGITGASGGGNQSMYAGALDDRFAAVAPVCSVGTYQSYLHAACCVCEVLPGALRFTEEGDVLGLVAPRALLVVNATKDALQFSVEEAKKSLERTKAIYKIHDKEEKLQHRVFESPHDYNQAMRETMYGFMTRWLKGEGKGEAIPEPKHTIEKVEDLACYPERKRPVKFVFAPDLAAREAKGLLEWHGKGVLDHKEAWEARAVVIRDRLDEALGGVPAEISPVVKWEKDVVSITTEKDLQIVAVERAPDSMMRTPAALLLHLDGKDAALAHPLAKALVTAGIAVLAPDLRATGSAKPKNDAIAGAPDHNSAEHGLWIGRPLLGQWVVDVRALLRVMSEHDKYDPKRLSVIGIGQAGVPAIVAAAYQLPGGVRAVVAVDSPTSFVADGAYPAGTRMGLLAPGMLRAGDVPQLAALLAPTRLIIAGGMNSAGQKSDAKGLAAAFAFTRKIYGLLKSDTSLGLLRDGGAAEIVAHL